MSKESLAEDAECLLRANVPVVGVCSTLGWKLGGDSSDGKRMLENAVSQDSLWSGLGVSAVFSAYDSRGPSWCRLRTADRALVPSVVCCYLCYGYCRLLAAAIAIAVAIASRGMVAVAVVQE